MGIKEKIGGKIARKVAGMMTDAQKQDAIDKFIDEHSGEPDFEDNLAQLKELLNYDG